MIEYDPINSDQKRTVSVELGASFDMPWGVAVKGADRQGRDGVLQLPNGDRLRPVLRFELVDDTEARTGTLVDPEALDSMGIVVLPGSEMRIDL